MRIRLTPYPTESIRKIQKISDVALRLAFLAGHGRLAERQNRRCRTQYRPCRQGCQNFRGQRHGGGQRRRRRGGRRNQFFVTANAQNTSTHAPSDSSHYDLHHDGVERTEKLPLKCLDGLFAGCDGPILLRADVQVAELAVLRGAGDQLGDVSVIVIEPPNEQPMTAPPGSTISIDSLPRVLPPRRPTRATKLKKQVASDRGFGLCAGIVAPSSMLQHRLQIVRTVWLCK